MRRKRRIVWTVEARRDLAKVRNYIRPFAPKAAESFVRRIRRKIESVADFPEAGAEVRERNVENLREAYVGEYRLMYRYDERVVEVMTVWHGARRFGEEP